MVGSFGYGNLDKATNAFKVINPSHHEVHKGKHFFVCGESVLGNGDVIDFQLVTPNTSEWLHMTFSSQNTQEIFLSIYEGSSVSANGGSLTAYNNNRNSLNTTDLALLQTNGTVSSTGTLIYSQRTGVAGNQVSSRQGFSQRDNEIILKQNTTYQFVFLSGGASNNFSYCGEWYEHQNED